MSLNLSSILSILTLDSNLGRLYYHLDFRQQICQYQGPIAKLVLSEFLARRIRQLPLFQACAIPEHKAAFHLL